VTASGAPSLESAHGEFRGERFPMVPIGEGPVFRGLLGIDMNTEAGTYPVKVLAMDGGQTPYTVVGSLRVERVEFGIQRLTLPRSQVDLDPETLERVQEEARRIGTLLKEYRDERLWNGPFISPVEGEVTSPFGMRRILNGQERSPHTGVDLGVPEGTAVGACNHVIVVLVDELFFSGKMIVIDHGWGIYSMYSHLSKLLVQSGERVKKGEVIGLSGSTGRVTGPHLDWRIRLNGARVDPLSILQLTGHLEE
jgi:murein DD-endopeptidase MepM/ murein hydrolase activator NlpD